MKTYQAHEHKGLLLNANESSIAPAQSVIRRLEDLLSLVDLNRYPEDQAQEVRRLYCHLMNLKEDEVMVTNGSDAALQILITACCRDGKSLVMLDPDFEMYAFYANALGVPVCRFKTEWNGSFDLDDLMAFAKENKAGLILISNPNNPTGHLISRHDVRKLCAQCADMVIAMDEAYMDFEDESALDLIHDFDNLVITRTLSKAWGAAGIRIGFLIACAKRIESLLPCRIVYSVSALDQCAACAVLMEPQNALGNIDMIRAERERIENILEDLDFLETGCMHGNFYALAWPGHMDELEEAFEKAEISIRKWPHQQRVRITIGQPDENDRVLRVLYDLKEKNEGGSNA